METFYSLEHLSTESLRKLYLAARELGAHCVEYDKPQTDECYRIENFPLEDILSNISSGNDNFFAHVENADDMENRITIGLPLTAFPFTTAYVDLDNSLLEKFIKDFSLKPRESGQTEIVSFEEYYDRTLRDNSVN